jgi:2-dehydropantoate 2-reductase
MPLVFIMYIDTQQKRTNCILTSQPASNVHVSLVCRSNYQTIAKSGVTLKTHSFGDYHFQPSAVYSSISDAASSNNAPDQGWDYIIVTTKALPDITDDSKDIEPLVRKGPDGKTCIVLIQNGVGVEEAHRTRFKNNPLVSAVTIISAEQISHGVVRQNRWTRISMGSYSDGLGGRTKEAKVLQERGDNCVNELVHLFTTYGKLRDAEFYDEVGLQQVRWHKICINASMNPSAVLAGGVGNADMSTNPELRLHLKACMEEVFDAAPKILGAPFPAKLATPEQILKSTERNTGGKPSMLLDWEAGRPMELEVILGNPVRIARRHGVEMARLQTLYALLKSAQAKRQHNAAVRRELVREAEGVKSTL